jgi:hypothetical protein
VATAEPATRRAFACRCGQPVFFGNSACLACGTPLGYDPQEQRLIPLETAADDAVMQPGQPDPDATVPTTLRQTWREAGAAGGRLYRRCTRLDTAAACNWLVLADDPGAGDPPLCRCCRLTRMLPDLTRDNGPLWWGRIEAAKRRLVSSLLGLGLPVRSKLNEDPERGLVFDLLRSPDG